MAELKHERIDAGDQVLVPGVEPVTPGQRLAARMTSPLAPRRPQRPADHGLFDVAGRAQGDLVDLLKGGKRP